MPQVKRKTSGAGDDFWDLGYKEFRGVKKKRSVAASLAKREEKKREGKKFDHKPIEAPQG